MSERDPVERSGDRPRDSSGGGSDPRVFFAAERTLLRAQGRLALTRKPGEGSVA